MKRRTAILVFVLLLMPFGLVIKAGELEKKIDTVGYRLDGWCAGSMVYSRHYVEKRGWHESYLWGVFSLIIDTTYRLTPEQVEFLEAMPDTRQPASWDLSGDHGVDHARPQDMKDGMCTIPGCRQLSPDLSMTPVTKLTFPIIDELKVRIDSLIKAMNEHVHKYRHTHGYGITKPPKKEN